MIREKLLQRYKDFGEEWQVKLILAEFKIIDNKKTKEQAFNNINWWVEQCEKQIGNLSLTDSEIAKYEDKMSIYNELLYLDEFSEMM